MKRITLKSMRIQNFGNMKDRILSFGNRTLIKGRNKAGKSTINDSYSWLLVNKMANGSQADGIRPHDADGIEDDNALISVSASIEIDGAVKEITKEQRKEFTQKTGKFKGNNNSYLIGGIPKKEKEFKDYLDEHLIDQDRFELCTNASAFFNLDTKKRRQILFSLVDDVTDRDIAATDTRFDGIPEMLEDCTLDELIQSIRYQINGRGRVDKGLKGRQDELPARIDEAQRQVSDTAEYSLAISGLQREISELDEAEKTLEDVMVAYDQKSKDILNLKFEQSEIVRKANEGLVQQRKAFDSEIFSLEQDKKFAENDLRMAEMDLKHANMGIERHATEVKKAQEDWTTYYEREYPEENLESIKSEQLDENELICPTCGQNFPEDQAKEIRLRFETNKVLRIKSEQAVKDSFYAQKDKKLNEIAEFGNQAAKELKGAKKSKEEAEQKIAESKQKITSLAMEIQQKQEELSKLPESVDLSDNAEYQSVSMKIILAEKALQEMNNGSEQRREINCARSEKTAEISSLKTLISESEKAQVRVEELKCEQKEIAQKLADCQRKLDVLKDFQKQKCNMLTEKVNGLFQFVKWELFRMNLDGEGYQEICEPVYNGTQYGRRLNSGAKSLVAVDLCNSFQMAYGVRMPIWIDNAEQMSADTLKLLDGIDTQIIFLKVSDGDLEVEDVK